MIPTFRPDAVIDPSDPRFVGQLDALAQISGQDIEKYEDYLDALRSRRAAFRAAGATATDHAIEILHTEWLARDDVEALFDKARRDELSADDAQRFHGHMLIEMAQMSADDGLVMQIHAGSRRNTNPALMARHGRDKGADIPVRTNWVRGLEPLLARVGTAPDMRLIAFTLDESTYARELAPMAGHWPAMLIGPPWWFHDSLAGIIRYLDQVVETAGYYNLAGFNDDTRAFMSIPARHDVWRRAVALHLSRHVAQGLLDKLQAFEIAQHLAVDAARKAYRL